MKRAPVLFSVLVMIACSHGATPNLPSGLDPQEAGHIAVIRNNNLFGWGLSVKVTLDDEVIAHIRAGEHITFYVAPGLHVVGVADRGISIPVERDRKYYFLISTDASQAGFEIERLGSTRGEEWLSKTRPTP